MPFPWLPRLVITRSVCLSIHEECSESSWISAFNAGGESLSAWKDLYSVKQHRTGALPPGSWTGVQCLSHWGSRTDHSRGRLPRCRLWALGCCFHPERNHTAREHVSKKMCRSKLTMKPKHHVLLRFLGIFRCFSRFGAQNVQQQHPLYMYIMMYTARRTLLLLFSNVLKYALRMGWQFNVLHRLQTSETSQNISECRLSVTSADTTDTHLLVLS